MQWKREPLPIRMPLLFITVTLSLLFSTSILGQQARGALIRVTASDESDKPVAGASVEVKLKGTVVATTATNEKGEAEFANLQPGTYEVVVSKESFEPLNQGDVVLTSGTPIEVKFTMIPKVQLKDVINVQAGRETPIEKGASPAAELARAQIKNIPSKPA